MVGWLLQFRSDFRMNSKRSKVWMSRHGFASWAVCELCECGTQISFAAEWEGCHDKPKSGGSSSFWRELFVGHGGCNVQQGTTELDVYRHIKHGLPPVRRASLLRPGLKVGEIGRTFTAAMAMATARATASKLSQLLAATTTIECFLTSKREQDAARHRL
jgi:hypothetical protein